MKKRLAGKIDRFASLLEVGGNMGIAAVMSRVGGVVRIAGSIAVVFWCLMGSDSYAQGSLVYVSNTNSGNPNETVSVYTTNADGTLNSGGTIAVGLNPVYVTVRPDQAFAYVPNSNSRTISIIDTATQTVGSTVAVAASSDLLGIVLTPDGSKLYVSTRASLTQTIRAFDVDNLTGALTPSASINVLQGPRGIAMHPDGSKLFVVNQSAQSLQIIGTATNTVLAAVSVGAQPINVALTASGDRAFVTNFSGASVSVIDSSTGAVVATYPTGVGGVYGIALTPDGNYYYVSTRNDSKVHAFNASTGAEIGSGFNTGGTQGDVVISPDGLSLYVPDAGTDNVSMFTINPSTGSLTPKVPATIAAASDPVGAAICRYGNSMLATGRIFVANSAGAITCMGPTPTFTGGTLLMRGAGMSIAQAFALGAGGGTIDSNGNDGTFSGVFSGGNALTKVGAGVVTFSGTNTNTGTTTVNAGTLRAGAANTLSSSSAVTVGASGTLNLNNFAQTIPSLTGSGTVTLGSATLTLSGNASTTFSGAVGGTGGLTKNGTGTLTLSGTNTYTGATTVNAGTLLVNGSVAAGTTITVAAGATLGGSGTINGNIVLQPGSTLSAGLTINGTITPAATSTSVTPSAATVTYATNQTFTATVTSGGTAVTSGTVTFVDTTTSTSLAANVALNGSGQAATTNLLGAGSHTVEATYNPDISHAGSTNSTTVTVNKASLTVTANALTTTYGTVPGYTVSFSGFVNSETASVVTGTASFSSNASLTNGSPNVGSWTITPAAGSLAASNYTFATFNTGTHTVNGASLTVTGNDATSVVGSIPALTATISGLVNGDTLAAISGSASVTTTATTSSATGTYPITPALGTLSAANYTFTFVAGTLTLTNAVPTLTSVSPTQFVAGSPATTLTIGGSGFVSNSVVMAGATALSTTFQNASVLTATLPASLLTSGATLNITVVNPGSSGGTSEILQIQVVNPGPTITSVAPAYLLANGVATTVVLRGANFVPTSAVQINGSSRTSTFVSASQLNVVATAFDVTSPGTLTIVVNNPSPAGGTAGIAVDVVSTSGVEPVTLGRGITIRETSGASSTLTTGMAGMRPADLGASATHAFARWNLSSGGVVVSESTMPAVAPFLSGRAFALVSSTVNTGFAIANPNADAVTVSFYFTNSSGATSGSGSFSLPARTQFTRFLSEAPFNAPVGTEGTITFSATRPVSVVVARGVFNSRNEFFATALPVADLSNPGVFGSGAIPQFTDGAGWTTSVMLVNPWDTTVFGTLQFMDKTSGQPVAINANGVLASTFSYAIPARSAQRYLTSGSAPVLSTGWIRLTPNLAASKAPSAFAVFTFQSGGTTVSESGMSLVPASSSMLAYVEATGNYAAAAPGSVETGIAISNTGFATVGVSLEFTVLNGANSTLSTTMSIPAGQQFSGALKQIPGFGSLTAPLQGVLRISTIGGTEVLAAGVVRQRYNERGSVVLSSVPLIPAVAPSGDIEVVVPHVIDGAGYTTSFVYVNTSAGPVNILQRNVGPTGQPLNLNYK